MENPKIEGELCSGDTWSHGMHTKRYIMLSHMWHTQLEVINRKGVLNCIDWLLTNALLY
jgi:hypothetical protein